MVKVSVLVPTYNEAGNIPKLIVSIHEVLKGKDFEIIVIDDNSLDETRELVKESSAIFKNTKLLCRPVKMGIGSAYKEGFKLASGDIIAYMDADFSHDPRDLPRLIDSLKDAEIAVGSRFVKGGRIVGWGWHRYLVNFGANLLARLVLRLNVKDTTSGYKAYRRGTFEKLISSSRFGGFTDFEEETLFIAKMHNIKVKELPIRFVDRTYGNSKLRLGDVLDFLRALFNMRFMSDGYK